MFPAVGLKKTWPLNGARPRVGYPDLLAGLMADCETITGPLPVIWNFTTSASCDAVRVVLAVFPTDRVPSLRFSVPQPDRIENGAPDCQVRMLPKDQPPMTLSSQREWIYVPCPGAGRTSRCP